MSVKKKLIEVALPLDAINAEASREKHIRIGHPSTLHLWWARRPLATARAVIWASLVDDPSSHPEQFPDEASQKQERERLFKILERLVVWENASDEELLLTAKAEILKSTDGNPPAFLDPFAGGGALPLEALRLGLDSHAHDINPVAVMINKAMIEIPQRFSSSMPINPRSRADNLSRGTWKGAAGLACDVEYYGKWILEEAKKRIGSLYPNITNGDGTTATPVAWIWARTVKCPNPACGCNVPLVKSFVLSPKKNIFIRPGTDGKKISFSIETNTDEAPSPTVGRQGARCFVCGSPINLSYIREQGQNSLLSSQLCALVAESKRGKSYFAPDTLQEQAASQANAPEDVPDAPLAYCPGCINTSAYGLDSFDKLFTARQKIALTTFSNLVAEAHKKAHQDAIDAGLSIDSDSLASGGHGALAYSQAISVYLAFVIDKCADYWSSICSWNNSRENITHTFGRQALPMSWDFAEVNPFSNSSGSFTNMLCWVVDCIAKLPVGISGKAIQFDAQSDCGLRNVMISTDPPYYDNVIYADTADFFYVWMRKSLKPIFPELFSTVLTPKTEELIANRYRFDGSRSAAKAFFENGMLQACRQINKYTRDDIPVTIYYAYKQSDTTENEGQQNTSSTGWETMLSAVINAGFVITGTWPMKTERTSRSMANGQNALASSIVLVCRRRPETAPTATRAEFLSALRKEMPVALKKLQQSNIAAVDLAQSAIGPGMAVFSRFSQVLDLDGKPVSVRSALQIINRELDAYFNEQDGDLDPESRFCIDIYSQFGFSSFEYGIADTLARAKNASISAMEDAGILYAKQGTVHLIKREDIHKRPTSTDPVWLVTQQLAHQLSVNGLQKTGTVLQGVFAETAEKAKDMAYRLYTIAERNGWTDEAMAYNALIVSWSGIQSESVKYKLSQASQGELFE